MRYRILRVGCSSPILDCTLPVCNLKPERTTIRRPPPYMLSTTSVIFILPISSTGETLPFSGLSRERRQIDPATNLPGCHDLQPRGPQKGQRGNTTGRNCKSSTCHLLHCRKFPCERVYAGEHGLEANHTPQSTRPHQRRQQCRRHNARPEMPNAKPCDRHTTVF